MGRVAALTGFGVVEAQIDLVPMHSVVTGVAMWNAADAARLAPVWQAWARSAPPEITTSLRMLSLPPLPTLPPFLAGNRVLALDGVVAAVTEAELPAARRIVDDMLAPLSALAGPVSNTWAPASPLAVPLTHMDPARPVPFASYAVGVAGDDTRRDLAAVRSAFEPYLTGRTAANFINHSGEPQRSYGDEVRARVERVRRAADPTGLFAGDVAPTRDRA